MPVPAQQIQDGGLPQCWRVLIAVPPAGFGRQLAVMQAWLDQQCGRSGWASAPAGTGGVVNDALAFYFSDPALARSFISRFSCGYRSGPALRL